MSSNLRPLLRSLLKGINSVQDPVFYEVDLGRIDADGFRLLAAKRVLRKTGIPEFIDDPELGVRRVHKLGKQYTLVNEDSPGADWVPVEEKALQQVKFDHVAMMRWIGDTNSMSGESAATGSIWTVGTTAIKGQRCRVLYFPGRTSREALLLAMRELAPNDSGAINLLLVPAAVPMTKEDLVGVEANGIYVENLYRITSDSGIDLELARLPDEGAGRKSGYYFRRVKGSNSWEVGFNTTTPVALPHGVAMDRIWLLLRNPGKEFTASEITNQLNATSDDRSYNRKAETTDQAYQRSKGTSARTIKDLTPEQQAEGREILSEVLSAKSEFGKGTREYEDAEKEWAEFNRNHGLVDVYKGIVKLENDDVTKEAGTLKRSIDRWMIQHKNSVIGDLVGHLDTTIIRGTSFSYSPPKEQPRLQWLT
jgi:hypothetical protein